MIKDMGKALLITMTILFIKVNLFKFLIKGNMEKG